MEEAYALISSLERPDYEKVGENYVCALCEKTFGYKNGLIRHLRITHVKEKPFECNICHRRFGYKNILLEHQNIHFGIKPYACTMCDKRFAARSNLIQHRMTHRKPYGCYLCHKKFDRDDQLQRHLLAHPRGLLQCSTCGFTAPSQEELSRHIVDTHPPQVMDTRDRNRPSLDDTPAESMDLRTSTNQGPLPSIDTFQTKRQATSASGMSSHFQPPSLYSGGHEAGKRLESLCHQLAHRTGTPGGEFGTVIVKQEHPSPGSAPMSQPHGLYQLSLSHGSTLPAEGPKNVSISSLPRLSHSDSSLSDPATPTTPRPGNDYSFTPPARRDSSSFNALVDLASRRLSDTMTPMDSASQGYSPGRTVDSSNTGADSTTNVTELLTTLQSLVNKSQETGGTFTIGAGRTSPQISITVGPRPPMRSASVQHTSPLPGFPDLDDVISYYASQGRLFECKHCGILFRERGLYFLHSSLHDSNNPWECRICHALCKDKNDFNLHFVNQQHN